MNRKCDVPSVCFENASIMLCWTVLAIYFEKWWIALFAVLCFSRLKWHSTDDTESVKESKEGDGR